MMAFKRLPTLIWIYCPSRCEAGCLQMKHARDLLECLRKYFWFLQEPGTVGEEHPMQEFVPRCGALGGLAFEKFGVQGQDLRHVADAAAAMGNGLAHFDQHDGAPGQQFITYHHLLACADQFSP